MNLRFWNIFIFHGSFAANAEMNQKHNNLVLWILRLKTKTVQNVLIFVWYKYPEFFKYPEIFEPLYYKKTRIGGREVWVFKRISSFNYLCNESISHWSHFIYRPIFKIVSPYFVTLLLQQAIGISYLRLAVYRLGVNLISNLIWRPGNFKDLNTKLTKCIT